MWVNQSIYCTSTIDVTSVCIYLRQVKLSDFAADVFSQAAGKRDHARQLTGVSSDQLQVGPTECRDSLENTDCGGRSSHKLLVLLKPDESVQTLPHPLQRQHLCVNGPLLPHQPVQLSLHFFLYQRRQQNM